MQLKDFDAEVIEQVLDNCEAKGFLDDARYAQLLVRSHIGKLHGAGRIKQALSQKGLSKDCILMALDNCGCDWFELARAKSIKKFGVAPSQDPKDKAKRIRHLLGQGFSYDQVTYALEYDPLDDSC